MLISNLQQFLRLLVPPLAAAGINQASQKSVTGSLEALAAALEPFKEMNADQLAELLKIASEYRQSGQLPDWVIGKQPKSPGSRATKSAKSPRISTAEVVAKLREIQQKSTQMEPSQINQEVQTFSSLSVAELKEVQKDFLGAPTGKTKIELLTAIQRKIHEFRASRDRFDGIMAR
jgi:hypothetical protein